MFWGQELRPSPSHCVLPFPSPLSLYLGGRMAFKISSACLVGSGTQEVEGSLALGGCGPVPEGPGCWTVTFSGRA